MQKKNSLQSRPTTSRPLLTLDSLDRKELLQAKDSLRLLKSKIAKAQQTKDGSIFDVQRTFSRQKYNKLAPRASSSQKQNKQLRQTRETAVESKRPTVPGLLQAPGREVVKSAVPSFQDIPLTQLKGRNVFEQQQEQQGELVKCSKGCQRYFSQKIIKNHQKLCKRVFQQKRKAFDSQEQRLDDLEIKVKPQPEQKKAKAQKLPKWKAQSEAFRMVLKQMGSNQALSKQQQAQLTRKMNEANGYIKCRFCGRSFNEKAGERHIPICESKAKQSSMKRR